VTATASALPTRVATPRIEGILPRRPGASRVGRSASPVVGRRRLPAILSGSARTVQDCMALTESSSPLPGELFTECGRRAIVGSGADPFRASERLARRRSRAVQARILRGCSRLPAPRERARRRRHPRHQTRLRRTGTTVGREHRFPPRRSGPFGVPQRLPNPRSDPRIRTTLTAVSGPILSSSSPAAWTPRTMHRGSLTPTRRAGDYCIAEPAATSAGTGRTDWTAATGRRASQAEAAAWWLGWRRTGVSARPWPDYLIYPIDWWSCLE
jgi:hypothetical protein